MTHSQEVSISIMCYGLMKQKSNPLLPPKKNKKSHQKIFLLSMECSTKGLRCRGLSPAACVWFPLTASSVSSPLDYHRGHVYVNWTICVPNHANRRKLVNHRLGLPNDYNSHLSP